MSSIDLLSSLQVNIKMSHALNRQVVVSRIRARARRRGREIHATVQENEVCFPNT